MGPHRDGMEMRSRAQRASARARGARGGCPRGHFGAPLRSVHRFKHRGNARQLRAGISARISAHPGGAGWRLGAPHRAAERWSKPPTHPSVSPRTSRSELRAIAPRPSAADRPPVLPSPRAPRVPARRARGRPPCRSRGCCRRSPSTRTSRAASPRSRPSSAPCCSSTGPRWRIAYGGTLARRRTTKRCGRALCRAPWALRRGGCADHRQP